MLRKFFCFARRSKAEAGGNVGRDCRPTGDNQKSVSGFWAKKVRILSKRYRQLEFFKPEEAASLRSAANLYSFLGENEKDLSIRAKEIFFIKVESSRLIKN